MSHGGDAGDDNQPPEIFGSKDEELEHWKRVAGKFRQDSEDLRAEHAEFVEQSRELEEELEREAERAETLAESATRQREALASELETWKEKYNREKLESNITMTNMQSEIDSLRKERDDLRILTRDLEQENDDLQRHEREIVTSLHDLETKLSAAMERTALLESELETHAEIKDEIQRLRDELRDQSHELAVLRDRSGKPHQNGTGEPGAGGRKPCEPGAATIPEPQSAGEGADGGRMLSAKPPSLNGDRSEAQLTSTPYREKGSGTDQRLSISHAFPGIPKPIAAVTPTTGLGAANPPGRGAGAFGGIAVVNPVGMIREIIGRLKELESRLATHRQSFATPMASPSVRRGRLSRPSVTNPVPLPTCLRPPAGDDGVTTVAQQSAVATETASEDKSERRSSSGAGAV